MAAPHTLYLHGFASGPFTAKGRALGARLTGRVASYGIPDLEQGDFTGLTMDLIIARALAAIAALPDDGRGVVLIGSSLGGYTAALIASRHALARLSGCLLIAPAFGFPTYWRERLGADDIAAWRRSGTRLFQHYGSDRELPLGLGFLESCERLPAVPGAPACRMVIVHGRQDQTVDHQVSLDFARDHALVELHLITGDHRLTEPRHEELIAWCAGDLL